MIGQIIKLIASCLDIIQYNEESADRMTSRTNNYTLKNLLLMLGKKCYWLLAILQYPLYCCSKKQSIEAQVLHLGIFTTKFKGIISIQIRGLHTNAVYKSLYTLICYYWCVH